MGDLVQIGSKSVEDYLNIVRSQNFDTTITVGLHHEDGNTNYTIFPSRELEMEYGVGVLNTAAAIFRGDSDNGM